MNELKFAIVQFDIIWENPAANLEKINHWFAQLKADVDVVVLPEMFSTGFSMNTAFAEENNGPALTWMKAAAAQHNKAICGSLMFKETNQKVYNRFFWVNPNGTVFYYNKKHLFSIGEEHKHYLPGNEKVIITYKGFTLNLLVCYDLRFPVWIRRTDEMNYDAIIIVANWPERRAMHWQTLLQARAIENQCFVIANNRVGLDGNQVNHIGHSAVIHPKGETHFAEVGKEQILYGSVIKDEVLNYRQDFAVSKDADGFTLL